MQRIELTYRNPTDGDAQLRLLWRGETFREEPLSPDRMFHDARHAGLQAHQELRRGRELLADLFVSASVYNTFDSRPPNPAADINDVGVVLSIGWSY